MFAVLMRLLKLCRW